MGIDLAKMKAKQKTTLKSANIHSGKSLSRRAVLKGAGAALALPMLDAMTPAFAATPKPIHRFQTVYIPNGMAMEYWSPASIGDYELTPILKPLAKYKNRMRVLSGLKANWNIAHAGAGGSFLTGITQGGKTEVEILADVSIDQILANELGKQTQLSSLELSMDAPALAGACTVNLSCVYTHTLSWRGKTQPLPTEHNPRALFERLFGDSGTTAKEVREVRLRQQTSILDAVLEKLTGLENPIEYQDLPVDDPHRRCPDITLANEILEWKPKTDLNQGLSQTIDWFRSILK